MTSKLKQGLEQRVFIFFLIITFLLVLALFFIEWQITKFGILQFENKNIRQVLVNYRLRMRQWDSESQNNLQNITTTYHLADAILKKDTTYLQTTLNKYSYNNHGSYLIVFDDNLAILYGQSWELVESYLATMLEKAGEKKVSSFLANFGNKIYHITYKLIFHPEDSEDCIGIIVSVQNQLNISFDPEYLGFTYLLPYPLQPSLINFPSSLTAKLERLRSELDGIAQKGETTSQLRLGIDLAIGIILEYDLQGKPVAFFLLNYLRDVNRFAQQSVMIFILILLAISIIMITILGTWFKMKILQPVNIVSQKMYQIANNPSQFETVDKTYKGVLGDMVDTFNKMNMSLNNYSRYLQEYKVLTDELESGVFWLDMDFRIIFGNPGLLKILEKENLNDIKGRSITDFIKLGEQQRQKALSGSLTIPNMEIVIAEKKKYILLNIRTLKSEKGIKLLGNITDITKEIREKVAREALELELIKSNRLAEVGRRVEGIVHNFNSPLNSLLGYTQLLKKNYPDNPDVEKILDASKNITHMVKGLLSKVKNDESSMMRPLNINELIQQETELCQHNLFFKHHVRLLTDLSANLPPVQAVYGDISLCLTNIINNAIETLQNCEKKELTIKTYCEQDKIAIEVTDSGEGIPADNLEIIFEPYFSTKTTMNGSGYGLGLAISRNIVRKYGGDIKVKSALQKGSTFIIYIPVNEN
ncbi:MAG: GHKL domain-containing protein [Candidatus Cloacimonetes bacterium]|nr:GHKL domain-containing protein [Candidatus Cloacimonadota bacterium]